MKLRHWSTILMLMWSASALAASPTTVRKQIEASMLVTGSVLIEPDGSVGQLEIDDRAALPTEVAGLIESAGSAWKFEPVRVDGIARRAKARMSLLLVANRRDDGKYGVSIRSGYFGEDAMTAEERQHRADSIRLLSRKPNPTYPMGASEKGARGTVYLAVKVGRQGMVEDVIVEQVNLRYVASESEMRKMRDMFARSALAAVKNWTFQPPTEGASASADFWSVRVPIRYDFDVKAPSYGEWQAYVPGPRQPIPWSGRAPVENDSPDALVAGGIYEIGKGMQLLTPLQSG
ncbi:MAG TPA: energy transducer TonB [Dokdonella sp.]|uniref:energy transducer TonB n=1 Tax=Dokdonella sp. TaxID=2291710 RepID=UPI002C677B11|nr:energy transducer TonB [Dokdonella sp.]HUD40552.1 energy transducer TonB [Dokdonella sp.]